MNGMDHGELQAENGAWARPVPFQRVMDKVNECMSRRDLPGVERVLTYWLEEARAGGDLRGQLLIRGEMVGHYRKTGERDKAHESAEDALRLIGALGFEGTATAATALINIATAFHSFGETAEALPLFARARAILEGLEGTDPALLGGLYNNMGLCLAAAGQYAEAHSLFDRAMAQMARTPGGALEQAITCLNRAGALEAEWDGEAAEARIAALLEEASRLLDQPGLPRNGYMAYVCETCAPTFDYYGFFAEAAALRERAEAIYAGT